ncbi:MAG: nucleotidyltransferase family protein [Alistipes sp.]|nr:nucleotidyltransferase family protein [Alistipes sp.]
MKHDSTRYLFALLRKALHPERTETIPTEATPDWGAIYRLATRQGVLAIAWDGLELLMREGALTAEQQPPRALRLQWAVNVAQIEKRYRKQEQALTHLAAFYDANNIRMLVLKGYGLSLSYPRPEHRPCGDIDIWLFGEQERADRLLRDRFQIAIDEEKHHHTVFTFEGVMVENHYDFLNVHAHRSNREIECRLQQLAREEGCSVSLPEGEVVLPSPDFNALFLLRHAAAHFAASEIGLRHVIDWLVFVKHDGAAVDWVALEQMSRAMNMHRFLYCMQALAVDHLGLDASLIPAIERDTALEERFLNEVLTPEFAESYQNKGFVKGLWIRLRRWWANRWKHRMVYREGLVSTFFVQLWSHLLKPQSFKS